ncbi:MAG: RNA polymerase sigma factor [Polaribacter sp.]|uniref:RNA polymerase sigma factor n=1 Tax=unclassified Polaribacter TaxID=196858 RepID=UPI00056A450D|nr:MULTISPECIES: RNA polymerase sigma factor [unclassified Polaribacter]MBT3742166.1 RNA polymerase sigma factor [Polaribacter sp.]MBT4413298.1 RNA polymerase sigma factor [Polaribacter sp.]MDG1194800.1 RNA polymerase sigma factor [Polaribacter sp.]MDG1403992.1 RNA polymerase sigma factor [Polaribacter sp.]MDG2436953.1 RNA polymerase sigma factor [Polaribacter sp.]
MDIEVLIQKCCRQNLSAQTKIYSLFADKLFRVCLKYSKNQQDAQDTLQDSFIMIFKDISKFKNKGSFEGWLKRVTVNVALQKFRNQSILQFDSIENFQIPEEDVFVNIDEKNINLDYLLSLIKELPPKYQIVFNLYVLDGYSHQEISELLKISIGTSKSNLYRARKILQKKINDESEINKLCRLA